MLKILVKIPTRSRPVRFTQILEKYVQMSNHPEEIEYLISIDEDDFQMNSYKIEQMCVGITSGRIKYVVGRSSCKIEAINRDIHMVKEWDILLNGADDMIPVVQGWDDVVREKFEQNFIGSAGCVHFLDGTHPKLCTMSIMNRMAYNETGWIYHPSYISLWCDQEFTDYWSKSNRLLCVNQILFEHRHPAAHSKEKHKLDALYIRNEDKRLWNADEANYRKRKEQGFPLN